MTNQFIEDCKIAIKELEKVVKILEDQERINDQLDAMKLNPTQKHQLAAIFLDENNNLR